MHGELNIWSRPDHYAGYNPEGHILVVATHRDADALQRTNWDAAATRLLEAAGMESVGTLDSEKGGFWNAPDPSTAPMVYQWSASSSLIGWIQYLMVRPDAPQAVIDEAQAIADDLAAYPALDEDAWSQLEYEETSNYWAEMSPRDRAIVIRKSGSNASIFAARRDYLPDDDGAVEQWLR